MKAKSLSHRTPDWIEVGRLLLDSKNYRIDEKLQTSNQGELIRILDRDFELDVIAESLADNGYFPQEPLVGIPSSKTDEFIIVEGNRRLAALKLILQPEFRKFAADPSYWEKIAGTLKYDISKVPVLTYAKRADLTRFLGHRHITAVKRWEPLPRARFIHDIIEQKGGSATFADIAHEIGSHTDTVRDNYLAYRIYLQAKQDFNIDTEELEKHFSVFYRALSDRNLLSFIQLRKELASPKVKKPISSKNAGKLEELIGYVHGTGDKEAVISDSRKLTVLGEVLADKNAYMYLRANRSLDRAYQLTAGEERRLIDNLNSASVSLDESLRDIHRHQDSKQVENMVKRCWGTMVEILKFFPKLEKSPSAKND